MPPQALKYSDYFLSCVSWVLSFSMLAHLLCSAMLLALQVEDEGDFQMVRSSSSRLYVCFPLPLPPPPRFFTPLWPEYESFAAALQKSWDAQSQEREKTHQQHPATQGQINGNERDMSRSFQLGDGRPAALGVLPSPLHPGLRSAAPDGWLQLGCPELLSAIPSCSSAPCPAWAGTGM